MNYQELVESLTPKENIYKNCTIAFLSGGVIGAISEILTNIFGTEGMMITWIIVSSILTGIGKADNIIDKFRMGFIIPITGFAHSVTASSLEYKYEGLVTGIGSNYFHLAGSVILYGIITSAIFAFIRGII